MFPQAPDQSVPRQTSTANSGCSPPDLHRKLRIRVVPEGPPDQSVPRRTSTASSGSECSPPDFHRKLRVFPAGPPDQSVPRRTSTASSGSECSPPDFHRKLKVFPAGPPPQAQDQSGPRRTSTPSSGSKCSAGPGPQPQRISEDIQDRMPKRMPNQKYRMSEVRVYARKNVRLIISYIYIYTSRWYVKIYVRNIVCQGGDRSKKVIGWDPVKCLAHFPFNPLLLLPSNAKVKAISQSQSQILSVGL